MVRGVGRTEGTLLVTAVLVALVTTGVQAKAPGTWFLEVVWILLGLPLVVALRKRFPLTRLLCWLLVLHAVVLCYGGQYTYAETPLGEWVQDWLGTRRNDYDRLGHFVQGFVPAVAVREVLLRRTPLRPGGWVTFLTVSVCLAISACFEFVEWFSALIAGSGADAFLATQGDVWDTQWDMFLCLCGAVVSVLVWRRLHDRQLAGSVREVGTAAAAT
jgi:putative membrane protein